jgi:TolA-binding protein
MRLAALAAVLGLPSTACFATRQDVQLLRNDLATMQATSARADSARARETARLLDALGVVRDSVRALAARDQRFAGDTREALRSINEQLLQVQELSGQSQRRLQDLRASLEARETAGAPARRLPRRRRRRRRRRCRPRRPRRRSPARGAASAGPGVPGAREPPPAWGRRHRGLGAGSTSAPTTGTPRPPPPAARRARRRRRRKRWTTGRRADDDASRAETGPGRERAPQARARPVPPRRVEHGARRLLGPAAPLPDGRRGARSPVLRGRDLRQRAERERRGRGLRGGGHFATRSRSRAPTALYKRARLKLAGGQRAEARALFDEVVRRYPRSDEAVLSRESLRTLDRAAAPPARRAERPSPAALHAP